jgi:IS30 family transposase
MGRKALALLAVVDELNQRPRKTLLWKTPHEVFTAASVP